MIPHGPECLFQLHAMIHQFIPIDKAVFRFSVQFYHFSGYCLYKGILLNVDWRDHIHQPSKILQAIFQTSVKKVIAGILLKASCPIICKQIIWNHQLLKKHSHSPFFPRWYAGPFHGVLAVDADGSMITGSFRKIPSPVEAAKLQYLSQFFVKGNLLFYS